MNQHSRKRYITYFYLGLFFAVIVFLIVMYQRNNNSDFYGEEKLKKVELTYSQQNIAHDKDKEMVLKGHVKHTIEKGDEVMFYLYRLSAKIYVNGVLQCNAVWDDNTRWVSFESPGIFEEDDVTIVMKTPAQGVYDGAYQLLLQKMYHGSEYGLLHQQIRKHAGKIFISFLTFVMGIGILIAMGGLMFLKVPDIRKYFSCGLLLITGSICTFID